MKTILAALLCLTLTLPAVAQQPKQNTKSSNEAAQQRARAIERCKANRGVDCETEQGLNEWLLLERSRSEARKDGSRSIHQTAPVVAPRAK